jgi:signal transduction histidine kinase
MDMTSIVKQLNEISSAVMYATEGIDLEDVLKRIAEISRNLVQCKYAALGIPDNDGGLKYFMVSGISDEDAAKMDHLPRGHGLIRAPMRERKVIRLARMQDDERSVGFPEHHPAMTSLLGVPIQMGEQLFGVLYLSDRIDGKPFTDEDQQLVETMAGYAALTIVGATSNEQQSQLKVLEERERIGMELHDGVIQSLYGLGMQVNLLRIGDNLQPDQLMPIITGLDTIITDIREYIMNLRAIEGQEKTIQECLEDTAQKLNMPSKIDVQINGTDKTPPFPPATFEGICLIINEALSNAVRHAQASKIIISADVTSKDFKVAIQDDGKGFDLESIQERGLGLANMHRRARIYGGIIHVDSNVGKGTNLKITIPIRSF